MDLPYKLLPDHRLYSGVVIAGDQPLQLRPGAVIHEIQREGFHFHLLWSAPSPDRVPASEPTTPEGETS